MNRKSATCMAAVSLVVAQTIACSTNHSTSSAGSGSMATSATPARANPDSFSGPIVSHCTTPASATTLGKLNVDTGELVDMATFPIPCNDASGQTGRLFFNQDFHKMALPDDANDNHVKYYDSDSKSVVDVTNIVVPSPTGDFGNQQRPLHRSAQFDDQGLFVFYDDRAEQFNFFDTDAKKIVKTSKVYVPHLLQVEMTNPDDMKNGELPGSDAIRLCSALWVIDDNRYLRAVSDNQDHYLVIDSIPPPGAPPQCDNNTAGQRITPPSTEISEAAADPTGSTILFTVFSRNDIKVWNLYRANLADPSQPKQIKMSGNILEHAGYDGGQIVSILGWK